ncbi:major facilitator superfamily domain-containing protein [Rhizoctonia solani]|nr:major facilitator superfamily domain-containing protein [Rhizoctonia solani]
MKPDSTSISQGDDGTGECSSGGDRGCYREAVVQQRTPLPVKQVFILCLMSFAEPVSIFVIFPFVNQMIEELGVTSDPKELGYYSGFIEGVFSLAQFFTVYFWGSLSDKIGRRPVLISGLCGVVGSTIMFGSSNSFMMMLISRALGGMLSGNSAVIKSVLGEITDKTNQGAAFAYLPLCWSLGSLLAPALGGFLSHPAERYPSIFGFELFRQYPYLLPCLAGSAFPTIGIIAGILFLDESLPKGPESAERRPLLTSKPRSYSCSYSTPSGRSNSPSPSPDACAPAIDGVKARVPSARDIMHISYIRKILVSYGFMAYVTMAINSLMVLWLYTPVKAGGIGFTSAEIGATLALSGLFGTAITIVVFPPLERRVGALYLYRFTMVMQLVNVLIFPLGHALTFTGGKSGAYLSVGAMLVVRCIGGMVFVCNMLLITRSVPCARSRGTVNALAQMVASASRAVAPAMATSTFAFSVKSGILGGNFVWLVLSLVTLLGVMAAYQIPNNRPLDTESQRSD